MNSLIVNTANKRLDVVLTVGTNCFLSSCEESKHNEVLIPLIDSLLKEHNIKLSDVDKFGVVVGPGSFTGIRVGIATVKAFRDVTKVKAYGINNLDLLFALATKQFKDFGAVAIAGSGNTYFVAKLIHGVVYKYDRNLSLQELIEVAENKSIVMFEKDKNINAKIVKMDAEVMSECLIASEDTTLTPVYYQLSQAEREKLNKGNLCVSKANISQLNDIAKLEKLVATSPLTEKQIEKMFANKNYEIYSASLDNVFVGFIILQITDEVNIVSLAVEKEFRNLGIATKLLQVAEDVCKNRKIDVLSLEVGYKNIQAFLLYQKFGFTVRRTRRAYYSNGDDCLEMVKKV